MGIVAETLAAQTGLRLNEVMRVLTTAPIRYKVYQIPKRNGGLRTISQPAKEVKLLQRAFINHFLSDLQIHPAATAYRVGVSLSANALPHARHNAILKMDFSDFFPSIRRVDWNNFCAATKIFTNREDVLLSGNLLFQRPRGSTALRLAIGAPSSPMISNLLLFEFDKLIAERVAEDKVVYTRYADDMTFSAPRTGHLINVQKIVARTIRELKSPRLRINGEKTTLITKKFHRVVTGLTLSNEGRVTIGRQLKRKLHASVHNTTKHEVAPSDLQALAGLLAFVNAVEPAFIDRLRERYGRETVRRIQRCVILKGGSARSPDTE